MSCCSSCTQQEEEGRSATEDRFDEPTPETMRLVSRRRIAAPACSNRHERQQISNSMQYGAVKLPRHTHGKIIFAKKPSADVPKLITNKDSEQLWRDAAASDQKIHDISSV